MSLPNVGDLAVCVHVCGCPGSEAELGLIHRVAQIEQVQGRCEKCDALYIGPGVRYEGDGPGWFYPRAWTRKVNPLTRDEEHIERIAAVVDQNDSKVVVKTIKLWDEPA